MYIRLKEGVNRCVDAFISFRVKHSPYGSQRYGRTGRSHNNYIVLPHKVSKLWQHHYCCHVIWA